MLHNVNLNIVNLNTLTLCLSIYNRMAPPTPHQMYPFLRWSTTTPFFHQTMRFLRGIRGILTLLWFSWLFELMSNEYFCPKLADSWTNENVMWQLVNLCMDSIYLLHIRFNLCTIAAVLVVVYNTDNSSRSVAIEAGRLLSASRCCRAVGHGASLLRRGLWRGKSSAVPYSK